jgi:hypothetical protein
MVTGHHQQMAFLMFPSITMQIVFSPGADHIEANWDCASNQEAD